MATRAVFSWKLLLISLLSIVLAFQALPNAHAGFRFGSDVLRSDLDGSAGSSYRFKRGERCIMRKINRIRARHGHHRLQADKQLGYVARRHANTIAASGGVWHDDVAGKVTRWRRIAQNTGRGSSCRSLSRAFMRSSTHRANILGSFRYMGIGTEKRGGRLYVQEIFESRRDPGNIWHYP